MPAVDRRVVLDPRIGAAPGRLGDLRHQLARAYRLADRLARRAGDQTPLAILLDGAHEVVGDAHRVVGVLVLDRVAVLAVEVHVEAGFTERACLALLDRLAPDELLDVGMVGVEDHHLRGAPRLPTRLDGPGRRVGAAHEAHRAARGAAALEPLLRGSEAREVDPRPGPALEDGPLFPVPVEDRVHPVVDGEDEARARLLRDAAHADVEPHGRVERGALVHQDVLELVAERLGLVVVDEVAVADSPVGDRVGDPVDDLPQRRLALRCAERAPEVLLGDDVRRVLRPADGELDVGLEEGVGAVAVVGDAGVAALPLDGLVRMRPRLGEVPADPDPHLLRRHGHAADSPSVPLFGVSSAVVLCCLRPQDIAIVVPSTTICGYSLHHRNYGRVNGVPPLAGDVIAGQTGAGKISL